MPNCLGRDPAFDIRPILNLLYEHPTTPDFLAGRGERTASGEVKLLVIPQGTPEFTENLRGAFSAVPLKPPPWEEPHWSVDRLETWVRGQAGNGLIVAEAPDVWFDQNLSRRLPALLAIGAHSLQPPPHRVARLAHTSRAS